MSMLFNFMDLTLMASYILYYTTVQICNTIRQTYSYSNNYAEMFDIHQKILGLHQEDITVADYVNVLMPE